MSRKMARGCCWADFTLRSVNTPLVPKEPAEWEGREEGRQAYVRRSCWGAGRTLCSFTSARDDLTQPLKTITRALGPRGLWYGHGRARETRERERELEKEKARELGSWGRLTGRFMCVLACHSGSLAKRWRRWLFIGPPVPLQIAFIAVLLASLSFDGLRLQYACQ